MRSRSALRLVLSMSLLLCVAAGAWAASPAADRTADEQALRQLKTVDWPKAYKEQDTALLDRLLASEFRSIDDSGGWSSKAEELDWVRNNKPSYDSLTFEITRLDLFENGTAIVAGTGTVRAKDDQGKPTTSTYQSTNVLIKRDGRWQAVASHISGVKEGS